MTACPYCNEEYEQYTIIGVFPANEHLTYWLDPIPIAQLACAGCGRYTFMHPDHPEVQRLRKHTSVEHSRDGVRTLNVAVEEVGDPELREQFQKGVEERA